MGAAWFRARTLQRGRVRVTVLLALFVGLSGAVVLAAVAGARRSEAALPRFVRWHHATDASLSIYDATDVLANQVDAVRQLPEVKEAYRGRYLLLAVPSATNPSGWRMQFGWAPLDPGGTRMFGRPIVVAGRLPREDRAEEAVVNEVMATRRHLHVGSTLTVASYRPDQFDAATAGAAPPPEGTSVELRVVGIVRHPLDLLPPVLQDDLVGGGSSRLYLSPSFWRSYGPDIASFGVGINVVLRRGQRDLPALEEHVQRLSSGVAVSAEPYFDADQETLSSVPRATRLESLAMLGFAATTAIASLVLVGQALSRQCRREGVENAKLIGSRAALWSAESSVPFRSTAGSATAAVLLTVAAVTFAASLGHLSRDPRQYGVTWDVSVGNFSTFEAADDGARTLSTIPGIAGYASAVGAVVLLEGHEVSVMAIAQTRGLVSFSEIEGHDPKGPGEIALGTSTLRQLRKRVGDVVHATATTVNGQMPLRIVGRAVVNENFLEAPRPPGEGGIVDFDALRVLAPSDPPEQYLVRFQRGSDRTRLVAELRSRFGATVFAPVPAPDVTNLERVAPLAGLLAALVAALALATLGHALATSVRVRRRELAILKTIGFVRRQVSATAAWQATTLAVIALGAGIPLGIAAARWAWVVVADRIGILTVPTVPVGATLALVAAGLAAFNLIAAGPAWVASRVHPVTALRSE